MFRKLRHHHQEQEEAKPAGPKNWGVESKTGGFPQRKHCRVDLFQDTHANPAVIEMAKEDGGTYQYTRGHCWESIYDAMNEARRFIYITGWSVDTSKSLLRTTRNGNGGDETIGELLRRKACEGVKVLIHIWDEKMSYKSMDGAEVKSQGLMCTHDEDTALFFAGSPVKVILSYRHGKTSGHVFVFTHHQKSVILDAPLAEDEEQCHQEGLKERELARKAHEERLEKVKEIQKKRRDDRQRRRDAGEQGVEPDSGGEDDDPILHEIRIRRKEWMEKGGGKAKVEEEEIRGPFKKRRARRRERRAAEAGGGKGKEEDDDEDSDGEGVAADELMGLVGVDLLESMLGGAGWGNKFLGKMKGPRRIVAFMGGLDLCDGRWDDQNHSLFRTLQHEHKEDFHNPWAVSSECGPREPWHDIHSKVEGPIARDLLRNFEQRWVRQAPLNLHGELLDTSPQSGFISEASDVGDVKNAHDTWNVQLFRSIDNYSAKFTEVEKTGILGRRKQVIESSIHEGYIAAIQRAEQFIYVENQYFMGSSQHWHKNRQAGCVNLVPYTIAQKIQQKIKRKEPFAAYIVIPMYPEGVPEDAATQEILKWQFRTQYMMNKMVFEAIKETYGGVGPSVGDGKGFGGNNGKGEGCPAVTDYLNFYCLGQRETLEGSEAEVIACNMSNPTPNDLLLQNSRRFSIYVHSKLMIVDDEYVIVGSANINQRSLQGDRDTELAIGAHQPNYGYSTHNAGEVHKFRMSLFQEHTKIMNPLFLKPQSKECVALLNDIGMKNGKDYAADVAQDLVSHLIHYPLHINEKGETTHLMEYIPDTKGYFKGTTSLLLVDRLTT
mmetsp:Transcript_40049/g.63321  ORF Transcript_40049/g.63321 Transcript_40049/m.63321 type:complete len:831 (-) Transcript_40049:151-2643(-)